MDRSRMTVTGRMTALLLAGLMCASTSMAVIVIQDPAGDMTVPPTGAQGPSNWAPADLLALEIEETVTTFSFMLSFTPPQGIDVRTYTDGVDWHIRFNVGAIAYRIWAYDNPIVGTGDWVQAYLYMQERPGAMERRFAELDAHLNGVSGRLFVTVDRADLRDEFGLEPVSTDRLTDIRVESSGSPVISCSACGLPGPYDRMPDRGEGAYEVRLGVKQDGLATLSTADRLRASNGAATTYFFDMNLTNRAIFDDTFTLSFTEPPPAWQVRLPYESVDVPANSSIRFPLLATIPFQHAHGAIETFLVEALSTNDPSTIARAELGVEFLEIPQPAGHHDTVYLHGSTSTNLELQGPVVYIGRGSSSGWFNTMPEDPRATGEPINGQWVGLNPGTQTHGWVYPLDPYLRLGLDFDLDTVGSLVATVGCNCALDNAWIEGELITVDRANVTHRASDYRNLGGARVLADILPTEIGSVGLGETRDFEASIVPRPEAELVPPTRDRNLVLLLWLHGDGIPSIIGFGDNAWMEPGGTLRLPLNEYHDPIDEAFSAPDFIHIDPVGPVERYVAPGGSVLYNLRLRNDGVRAGTFEVTAYGSNADWVRFPGGTTFRAETSVPVTIPIAINPPGTILNGETADVVIEAVAREDERMRGLLRLTAIVDGERAAQQDADDTDEVLAIEEASQRESPAPGLWITLAFLAVCVARLRRSTHND